MSQQESRISTSHSFDLMSYSFKKNKGIISRMRRSLSNTAKFQTSSFKSHSNIESTWTSSEWSLRSSLDEFHSSPSTPITLHAPSPYPSTPITHSTHSSFLYGPSPPISHVSLDHYANCTRDERFSPRLSPVSKPVSTHHHAGRNKHHEKTVHGDHSILLRTDSPESDSYHAPTPAMYWSRSHMEGIQPPKLRAHTSVVVDDRMFVFGGTDEKICYNTLYIMELDTLTWFIPRVFGSPPPPCRAHSMVADEESGLLYLFGGGDSTAIFDHTYSFDPMAMVWSELQTTGTRPSKRKAHVAAIWNGELYVFGGGDGKKALNDLYKLNLETKVWSSVNTTGVYVAPRGYHTGTLVGNKLLILGGSDGNTYFGGLHILNMESFVWHRMELKVEIPRLAHSAVCIGSYLCVIGGHDELQYHNDFLMLNLVNMCWETKRVYGQAPVPRGYHSCVLYDSRLIIMGGYNGLECFDDVSLVELSSYAYLPQICNFTIGP